MAVSTRARSKTLADFIQENRWLLLAAAAGVGIAVVAGQTRSTAFRNPLPGHKVESPFGPRTIPGIPGDFHNGVDIAGAAGDPIYAPAAGIASPRYDDASGNNVLIIHADGYASICLHMSQTAVTEGQQVRAGDLIGYVGNTGWSTGPHTHLSITKDGAYINPADLITFPTT